jgi:hypothetical protein
MNASAQPVVYRLNRKDEIEFVSRSWDEFASENSGHHLFADAVIGSSIWNFISDRSTKQIYRDVFSRVRAGKEVKFWIRCDSPEKKRLLEMQLAPANDEVVAFEVITISEQIRQRQPLLDPRIPRSGEVLRTCGWCRRVDADGHWLEIEEAVPKMELFRSDVLPDITHGICSDCDRRMTS